MDNLTLATGLFALSFIAGTLHGLHIFREGSNMHLVSQEEQDPYEHRITTDHSLGCLIDIAPAGVVATATAVYHPLLPYAGGYAIGLLAGAGLNGLRESFTHSKHKEKK
ncbi:MAG: hypothetical protein WC744_00160 [Patescibacteria group bacterium]|jgi:hypothetical protein